MIFLYVASVTEHNNGFLWCFNNGWEIHITSKMTKVSEQNRARYTHKREAAVNRGIWTILRGKPQNFVNWPAKFGKFFSRKTVSPRGVFRGNALGCPKLAKQA